MCACVRGEVFCVHVFAEGGLGTSVRLQLFSDYFQWDLEAAGLRPSLLGRQTGDLSVAGRF